MQKSVKIFDSCPPCQVAPQALYATSFNYAKGLWVFLLSLSLISCQVYNRASSSSSASTQTMFSVAVLLLLLAAGSGEAS